MVSVDTAFGTLLATTNLLAPSVICSEAVTTASPKNRLP